MKVKKIVGKIWAVLCALNLVDITMRVLLGKADTLCTVTFYICYTFIAWGFILDLILKIQRYKTHKLYKGMFQDFKALHKNRYKLYFTGNKEEIDECSTEIERMGDILLSIGEEQMANKKLNEKIRKEVQTIINETQRLMTTEQSR